MVAGCPRVLSTVVRKSHNPDVALLIRCRAVAPTMSLTALTANRQLASVRVSQ